MAYQKWREEFIAEFIRAFPKASYSVALALLRAATSEQRWNEIDCSIDVGEKEHDRLEKVSERRMGRVKALADKIGAGLDTNGDPRGCPFALIAPDGRKVYCPGRGLPARCFR